MSHVLHSSAKPSHYNDEAKHYNKFNEENSKVINRTIESILKKHHSHSVLDLTCGTGSQVFWLKKQGYKVIGSDISPQMLKIAKEKAKKENLDIPFLKRDMRTAHLGLFDAVITIFNAIGHLTKSDFEKAIQNIHHNVKEGGIYIFDIFNLDYLLKDSNITNLTIDWQMFENNTEARVIQYSTIDKAGILASYTLLHEQKGSNKPTISKSVQTLQIYSAKQLKYILETNGFKILEQTAIDGSKFVKMKTDRILTIAQKN